MGAFGRIANQPVSPLSTKWPNGIFSKNIADGDLAMFAVTV